MASPFSRGSSKPDLVALHMVSPFSRGTTYPQVVLGKYSVRPAVVWFAPCSRRTLQAVRNAVATLLPSFLLPARGSSLLLRLPQAGSSIQSLSEIQHIMDFDEVELGKRRSWTNIAHNQARTVRRNVEAGNEKSSLINGSRQDVIGLPRGHDSQAGKSNLYGTEENDDFISLESDRKLLLIN